MAEDSLRDTHNSKATIYSLGLHQLKCFREKLADLRHVKIADGVAVAGATGKASMGFTPWEQLWWMLGAVVFFHTSEFLLALAYHGRRRVNAACYFLHFVFRHEGSVVWITDGTKYGKMLVDANNITYRILCSKKATLISGPYLLALAFSMVEHALESRFAPGLKKQAFVSYTGLAMVVLGEGLRKLAVVTANKSFTHDIKVDKRQEHKLVTHGIYRFFRHPSYLGFFIWSIGTQVLLVNPVCTVGYTVVTWRFFDHRIPYEEYFLRRFFGQDYVEYASKVPSGMPFIT